MEREIGVTEARQQLASLIEQVRYGRESYIIVRHGKRAAALVPIDVYERQMRERERLFDAIASVQAANAGVDPEQALADVIAAQREVRSAETE